LGGINSIVRSDQSVCTGGLVLMDDVGLAWLIEDAFHNKNRISMYFSVHGGDE